MQVILLIAVMCSCAVGDEDLHNRWPCQPTNKRKAFKNFERNHILPKNFDTNSTSEWQRHITGLNRRNPNQTFFEWSKANLVKKICNGGGWSVDGDLCTSFSKIPVYEVTTSNGTVEQFKEVNESHVTVACDKVGGKCLPVHFHGSHQNKNHSNVTCSPALADRWAA
uniref:Uncharacterized protein n=1 Tax=Poecilia formosa TaxID=48698 RepID=A0A096MIA5_POEFO